MWVSPNGAGAAARGRGSVVDRLAALFLLEQVGDDIAVGAEANLVAFDFGNQAARDVMVMLVMAHAAVGAESA